MYKLGLEKTDEPKIKLPTFTGSWRKQGHSKTTTTTTTTTTTNYLSFINYTKIFDSVDHNSGKLLKRWHFKSKVVTDHLICPLRNLYVDQETTVITRHGTMDWFIIGKGV